MNNTMKACVLHNIGDIRCETVPVPDIKHDEVLIKVRAVGVCGTDIERVLKTGTWKFPTIIGHEFSGEIVKLGDSTKGFSVGDRVAANPMSSCGTCDYCRSGWVNMCDDYDYLGSRSSGAFAEYVAVKASSLFKIPDDMDYVTGATIDPITVALHAVRMAKIEIGSEAAVFGCGPIGQFLIQWLKVSGAGKVYAIDVVKEKTDLAIKLGANVSINPMVSDPIKTIMESTGGKGVELAFNMTSIQTTIDQAIKVLAKKGQLVCVGTPHSEVAISYDGFERILRRELSITGAWCYSFAPHPNNEWETAIKFVAVKKIVSEPVVSHRFKLEEVTEAFNMIKEKKKYFNKVIFLPQERG